MPAHPAPARLAPTAWTRRRFLGATFWSTAAVAGLAACSDGDDAAEVDLEAVDPGTATTLFTMFSPRDFAVAGREERLPFALGTTDGPLTEGVPDTVSFEVLVDATRAGEGTDPTATQEPQWQPLGEAVVVPRHDEGIPTPYFPLRTRFPEPGLYLVRGTPAGGVAVDAMVEVVGQGDLPLVGRGTPLPDVASPTVADPLGVDPICTRNPVCDLHEVSLDAALDAGGALAFLVSTPQWCSVGTLCGPSLELVIAEAIERPDVTFVHCEVYPDEQGPQSGLFVDAVNALGLTYEPTLILARDGVVVDRLDNVFDRAELRAALDALTA